MTLPRDWDLDMAATAAVDATGQHFVLDSDRDEEIDSYKEHYRKHGVFPGTVPSDDGWVNVKMQEPDVDPAFNPEWDPAYENKTDWSQYDPAPSGSGPYGRHSVPREQPANDTRRSETIVPPLPKMGMYNVGPPQMLKVDGGLIITTVTTQFIPD
jgi:hypothetical protein